MKKIYATIIAAFCASATLMAQNTSFGFLFNGEPLANGSVITIAEAEVAPGCEPEDGIYAMHSDIKVKNVSSSATSLTLTIVGKENWDQLIDDPWFNAIVQFCPNNNCSPKGCQPWNDEGILSTNYLSPIESGTIADESDWLHVSIMSDDPVWSYKGVVELKAINSNNESDCATITVIYDTNGVTGVQSLGSLKRDVKCEVFNLCGKKIANSTVGLTKGVYIIKQNGTSRKVVIK